MADVDLSGYVEVSDRIKEFKEKWPTGSFQTSIVEVPAPFNEKFIAVEARAYRTPDDQCPGVDVAWEPVPGHTPFTKDSELMNASTSAVGRAIVYALAADAHTVASADEVRNRGGGGSDKKPGPSEKQVAFFSELVKETELPAAVKANVISYGKTVLTGGKGGSMSKAIDGLKDKSAKTEVANRLAAAADEWAKAAESDGPDKQPESGGEQPPVEA